MMLFGISGACIAGIPLALALIFLCYHNADLKQQIHNYKENEEENLYLSVWILKEDLHAGEKVTRASLERRERWVPKAGGLDKITDIKQIAGRKAKVELKKGVVVEPGLLYEE